MLFSTKSQALLRSARFVSAVPLSLRNGPGYSKWRSKAQKFDRLNEEQKKIEVFRRIKALVIYAIENVEFYRDFYSMRGFRVDQLRDFEDIEKIPIVTKADLNKCEIKKRTAKNFRGKFANTGGSSGSTLMFAMSRSQAVKEAVYIHKTWERLGYKEGLLKFRFRGINLYSKSYIFNPREAEFTLNTNRGYDKIIGDIEKILSCIKINYLHGYPSTISEFVTFIRDYPRSFVLDSLRRSVRGVLLGSEYPAPTYRRIIEDVLQCPSMSWYGHSEMAVLASEQHEKYRYDVELGYGYVEAVKSDEENCFRLIGTGYDSFSAPFIRYDTGDLIDNVTIENSILKSFAIGDGRTGDFVLDRRGNRISLTGLVHGRHHLAFGIFKHIQIMQEDIGKMTVLGAVPKDSDANADDLARSFDASGIDMDVDFRIIDEPIRTPAGKIKLLI